MQIITEIRKDAKFFRKWYMLVRLQKNRLEHTIANENNIVENTTAAESQIRDADMAKEMVNQSMLNILSQVGTSMMAQANQSNQSILQLLQ